MPVRTNAGRLWVCAAFAALAGCASTPPEQDPVQIKLNDLDTRLARVEHVVTNQSLLQIANEIEALRGDVRSLHNDVDLLRNDQEAARKQQRSLYADVDQRLKALESRGAGAGAGGGAPSGDAVSGGASPGGAPSASAGASAGAGLPVPDGSDRANYQAAFALLKDSQYDKAVAAFQQFLSAFPDSPLAENAQYWLGEAYYVNKDFTTSLAAFQRVVDQYPQSRKVPDALLKIGYCRYELKQPDQARAVLTDVASRFADTPAGHLAQQRLQKMDSDKP